MIIKSALGSLRLIREKCLFRRRESLFGSAVNNPEQKTRLERAIEHGTQGQIFTCARPVVSVRSMPPTARSTCLFTRGLARSSSS